MYFNAKIIFYDFYVYNIFLNLRFKMMVSYHRQFVQAVTFSWRQQHNSLNYWWLANANYVSFGNIKLKSSEKQNACTIEMKMLNLKQKEQRWIAWFNTMRMNNMNSRLLLRVI